MTLWRCQDCKWHKSNITKQEIKNQHPNKIWDTPCDTPKTQIMGNDAQVKGTCFENRGKKET